MEAQSFGDCFAQWKQVHANCVVALEKGGTTLGSCQLVLRVAGERVEISHTDGSFFVEGADDARIQDLNSFLLSEQPSFFVLLDRLNAIGSRKKPRNLLESAGSLSASANSLSASCGSEMENDDVWCLSAEEKAHLLAQVSGSGIEDCAHCVMSVNHDLGTIVLRLEPTFVTQVFATQFELTDEKIVVTLDYSTPVSPVVKVAQFKSTRENIGIILIRRMVEHFFTALRTGTLEELRPVKEPEKAKEEPHKNLGKRLVEGGLQSIKEMLGGGGISSSSYESMPDAENVAIVIGMGFSRGQAIAALRASKNNVDAAVERLLEDPDGFQPPAEPSFNIFSGLLSYLTERFEQPSHFCAACHAPHRCGGTLPIICGREMCVFTFESYLTKMDCRLCPIEDCNSGRGMDSSLLLCEALRSIGGAFGISLSALLEMHRHRYLPVSELLKLHEALAAANYAIVEIESILNPPLCARFEHRWKELKEAHEAEGSGIEVKPQLAYHGTAEANIEKIKRTGLLVPGKDYGPGIGIIGHATDTGFWGKGIYLSPNAGLSIGYCRGGSVLLINAVLMGRVFKCTTLIHGQPKRDGFDSHQDPSGNEWILFDERQVLPCYAVKIAPKRA
jgi:hypothetical protein